MKSNRFVLLSYVVSAALLFAIQPVKAKVALPSLFTDHMVFQQQTNVAVWGTAVPGKPIRISTTWSNKKYTTLADNKGNWKIMVATPGYGGPFMVDISDGESVKLNDVLIGEVWLCSGQSNMEMPLAGWGKINNYEQEIAAADYPQIRLLQGEKVTANHILQNAKVTNGGWQPCTPQYVAEFSSVAYFYAREIYKKTKVPIGLIHTSWGGTIAEAWTSAETLKKMPYFAKEVAELSNEGGDERSYTTKVKKWVNLSMQKDSGYVKLSPAWQKPNLRMSNWHTVNLPAYIEKTVPDFDGAFWLRKKVVIPAEWVGKPLTINLGPIDDNDVTWFNGQQIGETHGYDVSRTYTIPGNLVKAGENVIAIRVFDTGGGGGLYGNGKPINLVGETGMPISLAGEWQYKVSLNIKDLPPMPPDQNSPNRPTVLFNAMINPYIQFAIRGAIWYQGESNADRADQYRTLFPAMIKDWRQKWNIGDFPFYFVQLANFMKAEEQPAPSAWAELRDAQLHTLALPNTGMAVSIDIGNSEDIHPKNKQEVGRRLALIALAKNYGEKITYSGPLLNSYKIAGDKAILTFKFAETGLKTNGQPLKGFAIAGADQKFYWAEAVIKNGEVVISSPSVKTPVAIRYGWANNPECNLYNEDGLPASPFRTDSWTLTTVLR